MEFRETNYSHWKEGTRAKTVEWFKEELNLDVDPVCEGFSGPSPITEILMQYVGVRLGRGPRALLRMRRISMQQLEEFSANGHPHHKRTVENMKWMKEMGLEAWIMEQKSKGQCLFYP